MYSFFFIVKYEIIFPSLVFGFFWKTFKWSHLICLEGECLQPKIIFIIGRSVDTLSVSSLVHKNVDDQEDVVTCPVFFPQPKDV